MLTSRIDGLASTPPVKLKEFGYRWNVYFVKSRPTKPGIQKVSGISIILAFFLWNSRAMDVPSDDYCSLGFTGLSIPEVLQANGGIYL